MYVDYYSSPIGLIKICANINYLLSCTFVDKKDQKVKRNLVILDTINQLDEYFNGIRYTFDLPLKLEGTYFQIKVWEELQKIEYGKTCTYKEIAQKINHPKAYRAVGNANNKNKFVIIIPCHRVIGTNHQLVGYAFGIDKKEMLLNHEKSVLQLNR